MPVRRVIPLQGQADAIYGDVRSALERVRKRLDGVE
jgi:hypothetical protein